MSPLVQNNRWKYFLLGLGLHLVLLASPAIGKNLAEISVIRPASVELLDIELFGNLAFVPGGLGGLSIIDMSAQPDPVVLSWLIATGCDFGRIYAWHAAGNYAYGSGRDCGIKVIDISNINAPTNEGLYQADNGSYEHSVGYGDYLFAAVHRLGVEIIDRSDPLNLKHIAWVRTNNAWALAISNDGQYLYVADGAGGLTLVNVSNPRSSHLLGTTSGSGIAKDIAISDDYLFVAVGAAGVDMYDISQPGEPQYLSNYNTSGYASKISVSNNYVAVADWDDIEILTWSSGSELSLAGFKNTGGRVMAVAMEGDKIYSAEWYNLRTFKFGPIEGPDIDLSSRKIDFPFLNPGEILADSITITNNGSTDLNISDAFTTHADYEIQLDDLTVGPGESTGLKVIYQASTGEGRAELKIVSDDADETEVTVTLGGNRRFGVDVGNSAADFRLQSVNGYPATALSDFRGQPVFLTLFASW